jgi:hypothetical protein
MFSVVRKYKYGVLHFNDMYLHSYIIVDIFFIRLYCMIITNGYATKKNIHT